MGILNATPNSFYDQGRGSSVADMLARAEAMLAAGASILDIGGASTKPGEPISDPETELQRILPVVDALHRAFPQAWLSIDTYHSRVAKAAVEAGVSIVNDVSAGHIDPQMLATVAALRVPYVAMHMQGTPETMQHNPQYGDVVAEVRTYLAGRCADAAAAGIRDIVIDPGFGFGKTIAHNFALLRSLHTFRICGRPILAGLSRKSMICKPLHVNPEGALNGTTALHMAALQQGANILRVHDVKEAVQVVRLFGELAGAI